MNIIKNITNSAIIVQWDAVDDLFPTIYTVTWTDDRNIHEVATLIEQTSYTITGLTLNTVYTITVSAVNRYCGSGPEFKTEVIFSAYTTSTDYAISPTVTASTTPMTTTVNPSSTTMSITTMVNGNADISVDTSMTTTIATTTATY